MKRARFFFGGVEDRHNVVVCRLVDMNRGGFHLARVIDGKV